MTGHGLHTTGKLLEYALMRPYPDVFCFSTTRQGGVSTGAYASLNCTSYTGDDPECVRRNRQILAEALPFPPRELVIPWQTHDTRVLSIGHTYLQSTPRERESQLQGIDALTTREPGVCLCISTADCIPILLYDKKHRAIAAVHAGWRGTAGFITNHVLHHMHTLYGTVGADLLACIGPGISPEAFEVGNEVYEAFRQAGFPMEHIAHRHPTTGKWHIDLPQANRLQLLDFGIPARQIESCGICTYTRHEEFFSARRLGIKSGRILSGILLRP